MSETQNFTGQYAQALQNLYDQLTNASTMGYGNAQGSVDLTQSNPATPQQMTQAGYPTNANDYTTYMETFNTPSGNRAANFTPVQTMSDGSVNILSPDEYANYAEGVMANRWPDYRNLQVGTSRIGNDAIQNAINQGQKQGNLQEQFLALLAQAGYR